MNGRLSAHHSRTRNAISTTRPSKEAQYLLRSVSSAASESEKPSLPRALREHAAPKLLRVVETLIDLLYGIVSDTIEMVIVAEFKPVKSLLQMRDDNFVTPLGSRNFPVAVFSAPLIVPRSVDFPARRIDDAPLHKERNLVIFNSPVYTQRRSDTSIQWFAHLCARCIRRHNVHL